MVNNIVSGPQVKAMDGSIYKSALGDQQASVEQQSAINAMAKSGGASIPVPANQPAYNEQAAGNQTSQAISNRLNSIGAAASANSEFDSQVGQKAGKRSKRLSKRRSRIRIRKSKKVKRSRKYYRR